MTITAADIKLIESERMTDAEDGGGRATANVIADGEDGNIFPKVSRLDAVYGRVNLRKVYGRVTTENIDTYAGSHLIITDPPDNSHVSVTAFSTKSDFDTRAEARDRIESYVVSGPTSKMGFYGRQPVGTKTVLLFQRVGEALPDIGEVYSLVQYTDLSNTVEKHTQYIRVDSLTSETRTFEDDKGTYQVTVITMKITAPLEHEFSGPDIPPRLSSTASLSKVRITSVADAARYYGVQPLSEPIAIGDVSAQVTTPFAAIVPTATREVPISLASAIQSSAYVKAGSEWSGVEWTLGSSSDFYFPTSVRPGSVVLTGSAPAYPAQDNGDGTFKFADGKARLGAAIDYTTGHIVFPASTSSEFVGLGGTCLVSATHGVPAQQVSHTKSIEITISTVGTVYAVGLDPVPSPGTVVIDFRSFGKWYRLRDDGTGVLSGSDSAIGTGTVDYIQGALVVTVGSLPDIGSSIIVSWGSDLHCAQRIGSESDADPKVGQLVPLRQTPVAANSLTLTIPMNPGGVRNAVLEFTSGDTASWSSLGFGTVTGTLSRATGEIRLTYSEYMPWTTQAITAQYRVQKKSDGTNPEKTVSFTLPVGSHALGESCGSGTVQVSMPMFANLALPSGGWVFYQGAVRAQDDGSGYLRVIDGQTLFAGDGKNRVTIPKGTVLGQVNYSTGALIFSDPFAVTGQVYVSALGTRPAAWVDASGTAGRATTGSGTITYSQGSVVASDLITDTVTLDQAPLVFDLIKTQGQQVVPGSVCFTLSNDSAWWGNGGNGHRYVDRNGQLLRNFNVYTGSGTIAGEVNYVTGEVRITDRANEYGGAPDIHLKSCVTYRGDYSAFEISFRANGSPLRPGSVYVRATALDGTQLTGTADVNGVITGTKVAGSIQQTMGVGSVRFGEWVPVTGNTGEPWYNAALVDPSDSTRVWKPTEIIPSTFRYSGVVTASVPLDANVLGLDPVRLPMDGRVPIYRPGDVCVVHNTQSFTLPNPVVANATYNVGRTNLTELWLIDQNKKRIPTTQYTVNLATGVVTMASSLSLGAYVQPLVARHRQSEMVFISDVDITGKLTFASSFSNAYPVQDSYVSSALLFGDLYSRVTHVFDQQTWTNEWADTRIGNPANATYNDASYPIEVLNSGAVTERWRIEFTGAAAFRLVGENSGVVATGSTGADFSPVNTLTNKPYFTIRAAGWGSGWAVGNLLRFNTIAAGAPMWLARTILPGALPSADSTDIQFRGDVDA